MRSGNFFDTSTRQTQTLRIDPRVVLAGQLLEMTSAELRTAIETELVENPALEYLEPTPEITDEDIYAALAPNELQPGSEDREFTRSKPNDTAETDWTDLAGCHNSLEDHLAAQLETTHRRDLYPAFNVLIASLDVRGYLEQSIEELALDHQLDYDHLEEALALLQACEPAGVGARSLQECIALQLRGDSTTEVRLAHEIVVHAFDDLVDRNVRALSRRFRALPELVESALSEVQRCTPFPADRFAHTGQGGTRSRSVAAAIDLILERTEAGWNVRLFGPDPNDLALNRVYGERLRQLADVRGGDEKRHLTTYLARAQQFIDALGQRRATLSRIGYYLIANQPGFVSTGDVKFLKSLTRRKLAEDLGLHESTISRATAGKHVQLANGEVISFEIFFKPALRIQQMIGEILATEQIGSPLSDERITQLLAERGVIVARRTVNKYRDRGKMLSSRQRRTA